MPQPAVSSALANAQEQLLARRQALGLTPRSRPPASLADVAATLPSHLGWGTPGLTRALRQLRPAPNESPAAARASVAAPPPAKPTTPLPLTVTLLPDLALAMLRQEKVAAGRVWWILRAVDLAGRGWLSLAEVRDHLTDPASAQHLCGPRQLRKLLNQGEDLFWTRAGDRLWLRGAARVAHALGLKRLAYRSVTLPLTRLCGTIGAARAFLYATFHSSTADRPISRQTLTKLTGAARQTQRNYERRVALRRRRHFAIGPELIPDSDSSAADRERLAWTHGRSQFQFTDAQGRHGPAGRRYIAWQLPNSYTTPSALRRGSHRRRRTINRRLTDLLQQGRTGNGQTQRDRQPAPARATPRGRLFCNNGRQALQLQRYRPGPAYWPAALPSREQFWYAVAP